jgi:hypothetical protein
MDSGPASGLIARENGLERPVGTCAARLAVRVRV